MKFKINTTEQVTTAGMWLHTPWYEISFFVKICTVHGSVLYYSALYTSRSNTKNEQGIGRLWW